MLARDAIPLIKAAQLLPGRKGKPPHLNTLFRWAISGVRGVKLRTVVVGGQRFTTRQWVADFVAALNGQAPLPAA